MTDEAWSIAMDPKKTVEVRVEGDWEQIADILGDEVGNRINSFEITKMPDGERPYPPCFGCGRVKPETEKRRMKTFTIYGKRGLIESMLDRHLGMGAISSYESYAVSDDLSADVPNTYRIEGEYSTIAAFLVGHKEAGLISGFASKPNGFYCNIMWKDGDEDPRHHDRMLIGFDHSTLHDEDEGDIGIFFYADAATELEAREKYSKENSQEDWYILPERSSAMPLYAVRAVYADTSESDPVFIMAQNRETAAMLYHKARGIYEEQPCEIMVSMAQTGEVCDE